MIYHNIEAILTDSEMSVFKRGRNAKSFTVPKNAVLSDYKHATGLEALVGYLYIDGQLERLMELLDKGIQALECNE
jgi:ribonuclease-3 family protein